MEVGKLTVEVRSQSGKNEARRLRSSGKVPGVCYGRGQEPILISLDPKALKRALDPEKRQNTVITLSVNGGAGQELTVMLKDYQVDPLRQDVLHVDFITIDVTKEVTVDVPVILKGKPVGVVNGGQLHASLRSMSVSCKPADIPTKLEVDVSHLGIGDALHVGEVQLPPGVRAALAATETIASVVAPQAEKTPAAEAAEAAATAEAAAGAPAAQSAAEAKGGEAKAEAKPAKEGGKEKK